MAGHAFRPAQCGIFRSFAAPMKARTLKRTKVNVITLGCSKNTFDSEVMMAQLKANGIAVDLDDKRLELARSCGADMGLNPRTVDVVDEVRKLTDGYGCDVYIEATGHPAAVEQGLHMIRKLGTFVEFSVMREPVTVDWTIIGDTKELNIHGAHLGPYCYPIAIDMLHKGLLPMDRIITHRLPLSEAPKGYDIFKEKQEGCIKVFLRPD